MCLCSEPLTSDRDHIDWLYCEDQSFEPCIPCKYVPIERVGNLHAVGNGHDLKKSIKSELNQRTMGTALVCSAIFREKEAVAVFAQRSIHLQLLRTCHFGFANSFSTELRKNRDEQQQF